METIQPTISTGILAGGKSTRMGQDKAFVRLNNRTLIEHSVALLYALTDDLFILANRPADYAHLPLPVYPDRIPDRGPLGGIFTALANARYSHCLVAAVDLPLLQPALLRYLARLSPDADLILPVLNGRPQGTLAIYAQRLLPDIEHALAHDELKLALFFEEIASHRTVRYVSEAEMRPHDQGLLSFTNVNTPEDLDKCARLLRASEDDSQP